MELTRDPMMATEHAIEWYERSYAAHGVNAQRRYPNEEFVRFLARHYLKVNPEERGKISILDAGCGSCSNLWVIAREGFDAYGVDLSPEALRLGEQVLAGWGCTAKLKVGSLTQLPYKNGVFDAVVDVVASFSLTLADFDLYASEVVRVLKPEGKFFLFTLSAESDAFKNYAPAVKIDDYTLNGIYRQDSPYYGCFFPHRFSALLSLEETLLRFGLRPANVELLTRTYNRMKEKFQYISLESEKIL
jgi:SAM-dependent methyltransferase